MVKVNAFLFLLCMSIDIIVTICCDSCSEKDCELFPIRRLYIYGITQVNCDSTRARKTTGNNLTRPLNEANRYNFKYNINICNCSFIPQCINNFNIYIYLSLNHFIVVLIASLMPTFNILWSFFPQRKPSLHIIFFEFRHISA